MPKIVIDNFSPGIQAHRGRSPLSKISASEIINWDIDDRGRLTPRKGFSRINSTEFLGAPKAIFRAYYAASTSYRHLFVACAGVGTLYRMDVANNQFDGTTTEVKNWSVSGSESITVGSKPHFVQMGNRVFFSTGTSDYNNLWIDINRANSLNDNAVNVSGYYHGFSTNPPTTPSVAAAAGGSLTADEFYGVAISYYREAEAIEGLSSSVSTQQVTGGNLSITVTAPSRPDVQADQYRTYCTLGQATAAAASTAQLYLVGATAIASNETILAEPSTAVGNEIQVEDHDSPPTDWRYGVNHQGRLWVATDYDDYVYFSKIDEVGSPVMDAFPDTNVGPNLIPYKVTIGKLEGGVIKGLGVSPIGQQLVAFQDHSTTILYGNDPDNIDISQNLHSAGCSSARSIATISGSLLFLTQQKQIWMCDGQNIRPFSEAVDPLLEKIPDYHLDQCVGVHYKNKYLLAYPETLNNNRVMVYDARLNYWTTYDLGVNAFSWWVGSELANADQGRLVTGDSNYGYVNYVFIDANGDDITTDNGDDITYTWQSNWLEFPSERAVIRGVTIRPTATANSDRYWSGESHFRIRIDTDGKEGTKWYDLYPTASNQYRRGVFAKGFMHRVRIEISGDYSMIPDIEAFEIEYEVR